MNVIESSVLMKLISSTVLPTGLISPILPSNFWIVKVAPASSLNSLESIISTLLIVTVVGASLITVIPSTEPSSLTVNSTLSALV